MSNNRNLRHVEAPPLPEKIEDWERFLKTQRTLNDEVEALHRPLVGESPEYRRLLRAVYDEQAVEGSLAADNLEAARMIREKAKTIDGNEVADEKLATIAKSLNIVLRRYHSSRRERRNTLEGTIIPDNQSGE